MSGAGPVRYGGWAKDRQGWFLGLTGGAWVTILAGGLPLLVLAGLHRWLLAVGWAPVWLLLVAGVAVPVRGRSGLRWAADAATVRMGVLMSWTPWQSRAAAGTAGPMAEVDLPGVLSGVRTHDGPPYGPLLARPVIVADARQRTWAVVARISHPGIGLCEAGVRARIGAGLAELMEGAATGGLVSLVCVQVRTIPDDGAERACWQQANLRADAPALARQVDEQAGAVLVQTAVRHEVFVTVVVGESRIARQARQAGGGVDGRARVLYGVMGEIEGRLLGPVGASSVDWLDSPALAAAIRTGFAPGDRARLATAGVGGALPMAAAGPTVAPSAERRHYAHDAWSTATCAVLLPDKGAVMGALAPVFTPAIAGERRSVTVFFEPISPSRADRMVGNETMASDLAAEIRRKGGFASRAAHRRDAARVAGQDERLAAGNALVRVGMAAAVTVPDRWSIAEAGQRLEAAITTSGFIPLRLDLAQDTGFVAACIPLGVGLPRRRGRR